MTQMFADEGIRPTASARLLTAAVMLAFFVPGPPAAAQVAGGAPTPAPAPPASASRPTLTLPPLLERRASPYELWKRTALEEGPALPPGEQPPAVVPPGTQPLYFDADSIEAKDDRLYLRGHVQVHYRDYVLTADEATIDSVSSIAELRGNVVLRSAERTATGDTLILNLRTREWEVRRAHTVITPESVESGLLGPIFLEGATVAGAPGELQALQGTLTTCDLPHPHYEFRARSIVVYPGRKLIARGATLYVLGHRVLPPQTLVFPLRDFEQPRGYLPEVGRNEAEGFYMKYARPYSLSQQNRGLLKLDLMEKRGFGTGIDQTYRLFGGAGALLLYNVIPRPGVPQETSGRIQHSQQFGSLHVDLMADERRSAYQYAIAPGQTTTSLNTNLNLSRQVTGMSTTLGINESETSSFGTFRNLTANLLHTQQFGRRLSATFGTDYLSSDSGGTSQNAQLNSRLELKSQGRAFDLSLMANDTHTISGPGQFGGVERLPEINLLTDTAHFHHGDLATEWPARLQLSLGRYSEQTNKIDTERALFDFSLNDKRWERGHSQVDLSTGFRQTFYGDGAAQYVVSDTTRYTYVIGRDSQLSLAHIYQQAEGFTPFRFDFPFAFNRVEAFLSLGRAEHAGVAFRTAYDFRSTTIPWQPLTIQAFWKPTSYTLLTLGTSYYLSPVGVISTTLPTSRFQTVVSELRVRVPQGLKLDLGLRYDPARGGFAAAKTQIDTAIGRKWHVAALVGYDGFTRFNDFMITRDLHCWELSIIRTDHRDWRREQGWQLYLRIKAFPAFNGFGVGQSGQAIDTSVGRVY